jgi:tetratricopeptide (TPR) repeat protein
LRSNLKRALQSGRASEAQSLLSQLKDEDPLSAETRGLELELLVSTRRWDDASDLADQLLTLFPSSARIHYLAGRIHYQHKNYARAQERFAEANRLHPHWMTHHWLGKTCVQQGNYEQAEALLVGLTAAHPRTRLDLAWLYERRNQPERALEQVEAYLAGHPEDTLARAQQRRLRASLLAAGDLVEEVDSLLGLGEVIEPEVVPTYVQRLLETGHGAEARRFVPRHETQWTPRTAAAVAWVCHGLQAYDLAVRLFLLALPEHTANYKLLTALESAARHAGRIDDVAAAYERLAPAHKRLYGRLRALQKK